jgi:hypothetical protein
MILSSLHVLACVSAVWMRLSVFEGNALTPVVPKLLGKTAEDMKEICGADPSGVLRTMLAKGFWKRLSIYRTNQVTAPEKWCVYVLPSPEARLCARG